MINPEGKNILFNKLLRCPRLFGNVRPLPENKVLQPGLTEFVGAVNDGEYGAVAFDFISPHDFTRAKKGWFFFDDEYVCMGAGIETPTRALSVVSTVNQTLLAGEVLVAREGARESLDKGEPMLNNRGGL